MRLLYSSLHKYGNSKMKKIFHIFRNFPYFLFFFAGRVEILSAYAVHVLHISHTKNAPGGGVSFPMVRDAGEAAPLGAHE